MNVQVIWEYLMCGCEGSPYTKTVTETLNSEVTGPVRVPFLFIYYKKILLGYIHYTGKDS
jgi:hypothetical protein